MIDCVNLCSMKLLHKKIEEHITHALVIGTILSRVSAATLALDIYIAILSVCPSVCLSRSSIVSKRLNK